MKRYRLKGIALEVDGRAFGEGDILVADQDAPAEVLAARRQAGTAELVDEDGLTPEALAAVEALKSARSIAIRALVDCMRMAIAAGPSACRRLQLDADQQVAVLLGGDEDFTDFEDLGEEVVRLAALATSDPHPDPQAPAPAPAGEGALSPAGDEAAGAEPGQVGQVPEAVGVTPPAADDTPPEQGGVNGDPAAERSAAGEPVTVADQAPEQTGSAGEGGLPASDAAPAVKPKPAGRNSGGGSSKPKAQK